MTIKFQDIHLKNFAFGGASALAAACVLSAAACTSSRKYTIPFTDTLGRPTPNNGVLIGKVRNIETDANGVRKFELDMGEIDLIISLPTQEKQKLWKGVQPGDRFEVQYKFDPNTNKLDFIIPDGTKYKIKEPDQEGDPGKIGIKQGYS